MKTAIIKASPRKNGNTNTLLEYFLEEYHQEYEIIDLNDLVINPCTACRKCQEDFSGFNCRFKDGIYDIFDLIMKSDLILLVTPIYSWYCTAPMKAMLDRLVYGMNKYYGDEKGPSLWKGKHLALFMTCGYPIENGTGLFEEGIKRYCKHSGLIYEGKLAERHMGYKTVFIDDEKIKNAKEFASYLSKI